MKPIMVLLLPSLLLAGGAAIAQNDPFKTLATAQSLKCQFDRGSVGKWSGSKVSVKNDKWDVSVQFDSINLKTRKARFIGNQGASDVIVLATASGITFIEQTDYGNLAFTTVFSEQVPGTKRFYAVTSRHMLVYTEPLNSQYHGTCKVWQ